MGGVGEGRMEKRCFELDVLERGHNSSLDIYTIIQHCLAFGIIVTEWFHGLTRPRVN